MTESENPLASGVVLAARLPLRYQLLDSVPTEQELIQTNEHSESTLRMVHALATQHSDSVTDEGSSLSPEMLHMQFKLDLMLDMVGELLAKQVDMPESLAVIMTSTGIEWSSSDQNIQTGSSVLIELFMSQQCPRSVYLPAEIIFSEDSLVRGRFFGLSDNTTEALEKVIFQHHRREIAQGRAAISGSSSRTSA